MNSVKDTIRKYKMLSKGDSALVCVSGGADSLALLYIVRELMGELELSEVVACHIDHGLRPSEDPAEQRLVERHCEALGVKLYSCSLDLGGKDIPKGLSIEEWARNCRYELFQQTAAMHNAKILTAHNMNDNAETVIFNIVRGSGLDGGRGIPHVRGNIVRPLLDTPRAAIESYCEQKGIEYALDSSNKNDIFSRNLIRNQIMPLLNGINSASVENIDRFSKIVSRAAVYLKKDAERLLKSASAVGGYDCSVLSRADEAVLSAAVLSLIEEHNKSHRAVELVTAVIRGETTSVMLSDSVCAARRNGIFALETVEKQTGDDWRLPAFVGNNPLPSGKSVEIREIFNKNKKNIENSNNLLLKNCLDYDKIVGDIVFHSREDGAVFTSAARGNTKTLKKLFNERSVPERERRDYPVAYDDKGVVWVSGEGCAKRVSISEATKKIWYFSEGTMHNDIGEILVTEQEIRSKVEEMGRQITKDFEGKNLTMVSVLKGAVVFVADLMRAVEVHTELDFMAVSSFKGGVVSSGAVKIVKDLDISLEGRDILIVEDILDSGKTLEYIQEILWSRHPASLKIATLLDKPSRRQSGIVADYVGFVIPDEFVVGYGLDYAEKYRNLPYIGVLKPSVYSKKDAEILGV